MSEPRFLEFAPKGYEPTNELKWIQTCRIFKDNTITMHSTSFDNRVVLCQKWYGAFNSVWVRVPVE